VFFKEAHCGEILVAVFTVVLLSAQNAGEPVPKVPSATVEKPASIHGVWRAVEVTLTGPGARAIAFTERPTDHLHGEVLQPHEVQADGP
jgi:hypothetical protein